MGGDQISLRIRVYGSWRIAVSKGSHFPFWTIRNRLFSSDERRLALDLRDLLFSMIGTSHERAGLDVGEAKGHPLLF